MSDATRTVDTVECPRCGEDVDLVEDGDLDPEEEGGVAWSGCAQGVCETDNLLIADWWEGTFVYDLGAAEPPKPKADQ